jgi:energy-coupling factor transport system ATP-binding protein
MADAVLEVTNLSFTYLPGTEFATEALRGVQFTLHKGEIVAVVGQSGAGKSTLLQVCAGLLWPAAGSNLQVFGIDVLQNPSSWAKLRPRIGVLLQRPEMQLIERLVGDDVAFALRQQGLSGRELAQRVEWAMEAVGLGFAVFRDRRVHTLSGGELRKVALAGTIAPRPELLLLDEPTAGLDPVSKLNVLRLLASLRAAYGCTVLMTTTDMEDLPGFADRLLLLHNGQVVGEVAATELVCAASLLREHGLDLPEAGLVVEELSRRGLPVSATSLEHSELAEAICRSLLFSGT